MKFNLRWQILLATICFLLIFSILSYQVQTAVLCSTRVPASGGLFVEGVVGLPQYLNPLLSDPYPIDRELVSLLFDGLTRYDETGQLVPALAQEWVVSEDNMTVRFVLKAGLTWHDGQPVTAEDVVFTYRLLQDENFPGSPALKTLWQTVTINPIDDLTVEFVLSEPYSPFLEATTRGILPAHLLAGVSAATLPDHPFNTTPVGTGPFMVNSGEDWRRNGRLRLSPNPLNWPQGTQLNGLEFRFYPDEPSLLAAFQAGEIQAINQVPPSLLPQVAQIPEGRLFSAVSARYTSLLFNLSDTAVTHSKEVRQALAYALDRELLVDQVLNGQGVPLEGPYLPTSWASHADLFTAYTHQPTTAADLLNAAGWTLPDGATVRQKDGLPLSLRLLVLDAPTSRALAQTLAGQWAAVGIDTQLTLTTTVSARQQLLAERAFDVALVDITPPADPDLYDFWSQEAIIRGQNYAAWNNRRASEALEDARQVWGINERRPFYETFLRLYNDDLPALTLYQHVYTYALHQSVNLAEIGRIVTPRDRYNTFANWFLLYRDVTIACPVEAADSGQ